MHSINLFKTQWCNWKSKQLEIKTIQNKFKDSEYPSTLNSKQFIKERNQLGVSFTCACANIWIEDQKNENFIYAVAVAVEMIYYLREIILPHCF